MAALTGVSPAATRLDLLQVPNSNSGIDATLRDIQSGSGTVGPMQLATTGMLFQNGSTAAVFAEFNSAGRFLFNGYDAITTGQSFVAEIQLNGETGGETAFSSARASADTGGCAWSLNKARGTQASPAIVVDGDTVGSITWAAHHGSGWANPGVNIRGVVDDASVSAGVTPEQKLEILNGAVVTATFRPTNYFKVGKGIEHAVFTNAGRPAASGLEAGTEIWNSDDNAPNYSDGTNWRDAAGNTT